MGRPKGGKNKEWSLEAKLKVIMRVLKGETSTVQIQKNEGISSGMISTWIKKYQEEGKAGLVNKRKPGNPLSKFQSKKNLTEVEQLQYDNMKLKIENERLKKGYTSEEAMSIIQKKSSKKSTK